MVTWVAHDRREHEISHALIALPPPCLKAEKWKVHAPANSGTLTLVHPRLLYSNCHPIRRAVLQGSASRHRVVEPRHTFAANWSVSCFPRSILSPGSLFAIKWCLERITDFRELHGSGGGLRRGIWLRSLVSSGMPSPNAIEW